jgi:thymidylate kinase
MDQLRRDFLTDLFNQYEEHGVGYCLLRNCENLPEQLESDDIDIRISRSKRQTNRKIINSLVRKHGLHVYDFLSNERVDQFGFAKRISPPELFVLRLDYYDLELYGVRLLSGSEMLKTRNAYRNFYIASDTFKFLDKFLFNYLLDRPLPDRYHAEFRKIVIDQKESLMVEVSKVFGKTAGESIISHICDNGFTDLPLMRKKTLILILFRLALKNPLHHLWHIPLFWWHWFRHVIVPKGEFMSISGPDGCGKTTVLELAKEHLRELLGFRPTNYGHFRPSVLPRIARLAERAGALETVDEDYSSPHRAKPSGPIGSLARFSYYLLDYLWGYFVKIRPALVRREVVIYDRYLFDMVADPGRSRIALPGWLRKAVLSIVPLPHTAIFVHVPAQVAQERKAELTFEEIEQLNGNYLQLVRTGRMQLLENNDTAEIAAAKLVDLMIERRRRRLGLDGQFPFGHICPSSPETTSKLICEIAGNYPDKLAGGMKIVFFRNDDVGLFSSEPICSRLIRLTELFVHENVPVSHSVVPAAVNDETVKWLLDMKSRYPDLIGIDQHGYAHASYGAGEFGGNRSYADQKRDIAAGLALMEDYFGSAFSRCFSMPKVRYNVHTKRVCDELGFKVFSGGVSPRIYARVFNKLGRAMNLNILGPKEVSYHKRTDFLQRGFNIPEISVSVDVVKNYGTKTARSIDAILDRYSQCEKCFDVIGIMVHHWVFDSDEKISVLKGLIKALKGNSSVKFRLLEQVFDEFCQ